MIGLDVFSENGINIFLHNLRKKRKQGYGAIVTRYLRISGVFFLVKGEFWHVSNMEAYVPPAKNC